MQLVGELVVVQARPDAFDEVLVGVVLMKGDELDTPFTFEFLALVSQR